MRMKTHAHTFKGEVSESEGAATCRPRGPFGGSIFQLGLQPGLEPRTLHLPAQSSPVQSPTDWAATDARTEGQCEDRLDWKRQIPSLTITSPFSSLSHCKQSNYPLCPSITSVFKCRSSTGAGPSPWPSQHASWLPPT